MSGSNELRAASTASSGDEIVEALQGRLAQLGEAEAPPAGAEPPAGSDSDWEALYQAEKAVSRGLQGVVVRRQRELEELRAAGGGGGGGCGAGGGAGAGGVDATVPTPGLLQTPMQSAVQTLMGVIRDVGADSAVGAQLALVIPVLSSTAESSAFNFSADSSADDATQRWIQSQFATVNSAAELEEEAAGGAGGKPKKKRVRARRSSMVMMSMQSVYFNQFDFEEQHLTPLIHDFLHKYDLFNEFKIPKPVFNNFIAVIRENYHATNPYHNWRHAFDVTQMTYAILTLGDKLTTFLQPLDILALLVTAVCHDVDHNALNNAYHINTNSSVALLYNDTSVLENHHTSFTFKVMKQEETNIFQGLTTAQFRDVRKKMISCFMATDMTRHGDVLAQFKTRLESGDMDKSNDEDRRIVLDMLIHCADLSNAVRPFGMAKDWAEKIIEEFHAQGDLEKVHNLPVSPMCEREGNETLVAKSKMQMGFLDYVVTPTYKLLATYFPDDCRISMDTLKHCKENRERYRLITEGSTFEEVMELVSEKDEEGVATGNLVPSPRKKTPVPSGGAGGEAEGSSSEDEVS